MHLLPCIIALGAIVSCTAVMDYSEDSSDINVEETFEVMRDSILSGRVPAVEFFPSIARFMTVDRCQKNVVMLLKELKRNNVNLEVPLSIPMPKKNSRRSDVMYTTSSSGTDDEEDSMNEMTFFHQAFRCLPLEYFQLVVKLDIGHQNAGNLLHLIKLFSIRPNSKDYLANFQYLLTLKPTRQLLMKDPRFIEEACKTGLIAFIKYYLAHGGSLEAITSEPAVFLLPRSTKLIDFALATFGKTELTRRSSKKQTLLHHWIPKLKLRHLEKLIDLGLDPNAVDEEGNTALHLLLQNPYGTSIPLLDQLLLLTKPVRNCQGKLPVDIILEVSAKNPRKNRRPSLYALENFIPPSAAEFMSSSSSVSYEQENLTLDKDYETMGPYEDYYDSSLSEGDDYVRAIEMLRHKVRAHHCSNVIEAAKEAFPEHMAALGFDEGQANAFQEHIFDHIKYWLIKVQDKHTVKLDNKEIPWGVDVICRTVHKIASGESSESKKERKKSKKDKKDKKDKKGKSKKVRKHKRRHHRY